VGIRSVVWGIRHTTLEPGKSKKTTIWIAKLLAKLSWWLPAKIVVCAQRAMDVHEALGYDRSKMRFIPNGYDLANFHPGLDPKGEMKATLVADQSVPLIGTVGRFDPQKDHTNLLDALTILRDRGLAFQCVLVGTALDSSNAQIVDWIAQRGLVDHVQLLGRRNDIPNIMNALDLHVLPSFSVRHSPMLWLRRWHAVPPAWSPMWATRLISWAIRAGWYRRVIPMLWLMQLPLRFKM